MTERQDTLLEKRDGRYFAIDKFQTGLASLVKAEKIGRYNPRCVHFGLPSGPALFLNAARRSYIQVKEFDIEQMFYQWQNGRIPINSSKLFDYFELFAAHVIFSFTALEAFANEMIPKDFEYQTANQKKEKITLKKDDIERCSKLDDKLGDILPLALGVKTPKGTEIWEDYRLLRRMRDRLIHLKSIDRESSGPEIESIWGIMLRSHGKAFCDYAHKMMGQFLPDNNRRWHREYPYSVVESDKESDNTSF